MRCIDRKVRRNSASSMLCTQCCAFRLMCWHAASDPVAHVTCAQLPVMLKLRDSWGKVHSGLQELMDRGA